MPTGLVIGGDNGEARGVERITFTFCFGGTPPWARPDFPPLTHKKAEITSSAPTTTTPEPV